MEFDDLQALIWAHEYGSLKGAAKATKVSRTALRRRLDRLEAALGRPTHHSGPDGITLTAAGHALIEEGRSLLEARQRLLDRARGIRSRDHTLRVLVQQGVPPRVVAIGSSVLASMVPEVRIVVEHTAHPSSRLDERFDAILHWGGSPLIRTGYTRRIHTIGLGVMASPAYLARHGTPASPADLDHHTVLHLEGTEPAWPLRDGSSVAIQPGHATTDRYLLGLFAGQGLGLALLPVRGPSVDDLPAMLAPARGGLLDPSIEALEQVLTEYVWGEWTVRLDVPIPTEPDSAAARLVQMASMFGQELEVVGSGSEPAR